MSGKKKATGFNKYLLYVYHVYVVNKLTMAARTRGSDNNMMTTSTETLYPDSNFVVIDGQSQQVFCQITTIGEVDDLLIWSMRNGEQITTNTSYSSETTEDPGPTGINMETRLLYSYSYALEWIPHVRQRGADLRCKIVGYSPGTENDVSVALAVIGKS